MIEEFQKELILKKCLIAELENEQMRVNGYMKEDS